MKREVCRLIAGGRVVGGVLKIPAVKVSCSKCEK